MDKNHCYYLEGTDGVGKDSIGSMIASAQGLNISKLTLCLDNPWDCDRTGEIPPDHPLFPIYLLRAAIWDVLNFDPQQSQLQISLIGPRSAAWCLAGQEGLASYFLELLQYYPAFDSTVLLQASLEEKRSRMIGRAESGQTAVSAIDQLAFTRPEFVSAMDDFLAQIIRRQFKGAVIDTTEMSIDEACKAVTAVFVKSISLDRDSETASGRSRLMARSDYFYEVILRQAHDAAARFSMPTGELARVQAPLIPT